MTCLLQSASALTYDELQGLTYLQVKGSGIANTCPVIEGGSSNLKDLKPASYKISKFCMEPTAFKVKEESQFANKPAEFVKTKLMTRLTYTLDEVFVDLAAGSTFPAHFHFSLGTKTCTRISLNTKVSTQTSLPIRPWLSCKLNSSPYSFPCILGSMTQLGAYISPELPPQHVCPFCVDVHGLPTHSNLCTHLLFKFLYCILWH